MDLAQKSSHKVFIYLLEMRLNSKRPSRKALLTQIKELWFVNWALGFLPGQECAIIQLPESYSAQSWKFFSVLKKMLGLLDSSLES